MNKPQEILSWYAAFQQETHSIDMLIDMRRRLAVACAGMASDIAEKEREYHDTYQRRRISEAQKYLRVTGTVDERRAKAMDEDLRLKEAALDGERKGVKHLLDAYSKVLDSMSSYVNLRRNG